MKKNKQQQQPIYQVRKLLRGDEEFVGNSHWASNCEDCQEDVKIERDPITQFPLSYQCDRNPQWVTSSTMVQFDYELAITTKKNQRDNVLAMQWQFLEQVAERTGLSERCNFEFQFEDANTNSIRPRNNGNRRRRMLNKKLYYPTTIYAIRSLPEDRPGSIGDCLSLSYDSETSDCFPVTAIMTVKYRGEPQDASFVQEYVKSVIEEQIREDPSKLYVQDVTGLEYLGERIHFVKTDDGDDGARRIESQKGWGIATMTTVVTLCTLICLGIAILIIRKRNKKETTNPPQKVKIENFPFDLQECSTDSLPLEYGSGNDEYDVPLTLMASTEEMELPPSTDQYQHHVDQDCNDDLQNQSPAIQDLPPAPIDLQLPPIGRPLKVQRKKKQKDSISQSSSFSTLLPISETNSENESESVDDCDQSADINLSFGQMGEPMTASDDGAFDKDYESIMDDIFLTEEMRDL